MGATTRDDSVLQRHCCLDRPPTGADSYSNTRRCTVAEAGGRTFKSVRDLRLLRKQGDVKCQSKLHGQDISSFVVTESNLIYIVMYKSTPLLRSVTVWCVRIYHYPSAPSGRTHSGQPPLIARLMSCACLTLARTLLSALPSSLGA